MDKEEFCSKALFRVTGGIDLAGDQAALMTLAELIENIKDSVWAGPKNGEYPDNFTMKIEYIPFIRDVQEDEDDSA